MRIISGRLKGRRLKAALPEGIRPTSDKLRETLFNVLGPRIEGAAFLDGFAGMGGVGIEAISRGAAFTCFVDKSRKACAIIRENLESLSVTGGFRVIEADLEKALDLFEREGVVFDIVFLDPPYERETLYAESLSAFGIFDVSKIIDSYCQSITPGFVRPGLFQSTCQPVVAVRITIQQIPHTAHLVLGKFPFSFGRGRRSCRRWFYGRCFRRQLDRGFSDLSCWFGSGCGRGRCQSWRWNRRGWNTCRQET